MNGTTLFCIGIGIAFSSLFLRMVNSVPKQAFDASTDTGLVLSGVILGTAVMVCGLILHPVNK